ncbi:hypothetical protein SKAU_G00144790 [Synaphobranchus kaupii]|uniref:Uncharacterized protein n=1 Tax=Synaphobranchus kaupii TaxID=118154 RepID=A0A9Q1FU25_SYNKA|nr:hypothetical protein SKAU_G00144790 [Synaphobranchus kaupii]
MGEEGNEVAICQTRGRGTSTARAPRGQRGAGERDPRGKGERSAEKRPANVSLSPPRPPPQAGRALQLGAAGRYWRMGARRPTETHGVDFVFADEPVRASPPPSLAVVSWPPRREPVTVTEVHSVVTAPEPWPLRRARGQRGRGDVSQREEGASGRTRPEGPAAPRKLGPRRGPRNSPKKSHVSLPSDAQRGLWREYGNSVARRTICGRVLHSHVTHSIPASSHIRDSSEPRWRPTKTAAAELLSDPGHGCGYRVPRTPESLGKAGLWRCSGAAAEHAR